MQPSVDSAAPASASLDEAITIMQPLVAWMVRAGVGYSAFAAALKPVFLAQAQAELARLGRKPTDTGLSLLSGLHRKDVRQFRESARQAVDDARARGTGWGRPSPASQVVARWLALGWPELLPVAGPEPSFETLARRVHTDFHPRALLDDLTRLGVVTEEGTCVRLCRSAFVPDADSAEARQLLAGSVADHLSAGVSNLHGDGGRAFLEQSVFADGLSEQSITELQRLANELWREALARVMEAATPMCERDQGVADPQRFRLGMFSFAAAADQTKDQGRQR